MFYSYDAFSYVSVMYITVHEALLRRELSTSINCFSFASALHTQAAFLKKLFIGMSVGEKKKYHITESAVL